MAWGFTVGNRIRVRIRVRFRYTKRRGVNSSNDSDLKINRGDKHSSRLHDVLMLLKLPQNESTAEKHMHMRIYFVFQDLDCGRCFSN